MPNFTVSSPYQPSGDQPVAIEQLSHSIEKGNKYQTLLGVTGSGKILHRGHGVRHLRSKKSKRRLRAQAIPKEVKGTFKKKIKLMIAQ